MRSFLTCLLSSALFLFVGGLDRAQASAPNLQLPPLQHLILTNRLPVSFSETSLEERVEVRLVFNFGIDNDPTVPPGTTRLALEAMLKGSSTHSAGQLAKQLKRLDAKLSSEVFLDSAYLAINVRANAAREAIELLSDLTQKPSFPKQGLEAIRAEVEEVIGKMNARLWLHEEAMQLAIDLTFNEHPYAHNPLLFLNQSIQQLEVSRLQAFHRRWIRPDNAALVVVGDISVTKLVPLLEQTFGAWRAPDEPRAEPTSTAIRPSKHRARARIVLVDQPAAKSVSIVGVAPSPRCSDEDYPALVGVANILGGGRDSRLYQGQRAKGLGFNVTTQLHDGRNGGVLVVKVFPFTLSAAESLRQAMDDIEALASTQPPTAAELTAVRPSLIEPLLQQQLDTTKIAGLYHRGLMFGLPEDYWKRLDTLIKAVSLEQIQALTSPLLLQNRFTWVVIGNLQQVEAPIRALNLGDVSVTDLQGRTLPRH